MRRALTVAIVLAVLAAGYVFFFGGSDQQTKVQLAAMQKQLEEAKSKAAELEQAKQKEAQARIALENARAASDRLAAEKASTDKLAAEKTALEAERQRLAAEKAAAEAKAAAANASAGDPFQVATALESEGKGRDAVKAYTAAARRGNCQAAKRLGDIYDRGLMGIARDYAESLKWYNAARVLGCDMPTAKSRDDGAVITARPRAPHDAPTAVPQAGIERFPTMEAPDAVAPKDTFVVQISLTIDRIAPGVRVQPGPGTAVTQQGAMSLPLPGGRKSWTLDVVLSAPGFALVEGSNFGRITLPSDGDSTPAAFKLRPAANYKGPVARTLYATLSHEGRYLGRMSKPILVDAGVEARRKLDPDMVAAPTTVRGISNVQFEEGRYTPDLTLIVLDATEGAQGTSEVIVLSPHLQPRRETIRKSADTERWVQAQYEKVLTAMQESPPGQMAARTVPLLNGFGAQLYDQFAPPSFRRAYAQLAKGDGSKFQSIQILTNNPSVPWELMRPVGVDGARGDFLGATHRVARWHLVSSGADLPSPLQRVSLNEIVAIAPRYSGVAALDGQSRELDALRRLRGAQVVDGRLKTISQLFQRRPAGIVHFAGHGEATKTAAGVATYAIKLEDATLDVTAWRGLADGPIGRGALVFFNACDVGQASAVARFVEGWAPAMLEAGASGYIGGLWPLSDQGAAEYAVRFYAGLTKSAAEGDVVVSDLLRENRRAFRETGDPTFLAYVFYGDVNLRVGH